jgi:hypothetical protein
MHFEAAFPARVVSTMLPELTHVAFFDRVGLNPDGVSGIRLGAEAGEGSGIASGIDLAKVWLCLPASPCT